VVQETHEEFDISNFGLSKFEASLNLINKEGQRLSSFEIKELTQSYLDYKHKELPNSGNVFH